MRILLALSVAVTMTACAGPEDMAKVAATSQPPSMALRNQIAGDARDYLDPYSVRDAEISNVGTFDTGLQVICVKANATNKMAGYSGRQTLGITIKDGRIMHRFFGHPYCSYSSLQWRKFTELEALKNL